MWRCLRVHDKVVDKLILQLLKNTLANLQEWVLAKEVVLMLCIWKNKIIWNKNEMTHIYYKKQVTNSPCQEILSFSAS